MCGASALHDLTISQGPFTKCHLCGLRIQTMVKVKQEYRCTEVLASEPGRIGEKRGKWSLARELEGCEVRH